MIAKPAEAPMVSRHQQQTTRSWTTRRDEKKRRMQLISSWMSGPLLPREKLVESFEALIAPGDRVVLEGDNQKQADFLSRSLIKVDPKKLHDLHLIISSISRPEHLTLFELGIAKKVDFAFAGPQSLRVAQLLEDGVLEIGAIHTYVELYARLLVDLAPPALVRGARSAQLAHRAPLSAAQEHVRTLPPQQTPPAHSARHVGVKGHDRLGRHRDPRVDHGAPRGPRGAPREPPRSSAATLRLGDTAWKPARQGRPGHSVEDRPQDGNHDDPGAGRDAAFRVAHAG